MKYRVLALTLGWAFSSIFLTPPINNFEIVVTVAGLVLFATLYFRDTRSVQ